jgi:N-acetylmuramoyl-L-alanine amidase
MIKPIVPYIRSVGAIRAQIIESRAAEDDIQEDLKSTLEESPICKDENELREYIRTAKITRKITHLFVHCTATQPDAKVSSILKYWKEKMKWSSVGYHIILPQEGFTVLSDFNGITNGVQGYNSIGVHISYIGGIDKAGKALDTRTASQARLIRVFIEEMVKRFPKIKVLAHNEVSNKACPSFKVKDAYKEFWTGK